MGYNAYTNPIINKAWFYAIAPSAIRNYQMSLNGIYLIGKQK